MNSRRAFPFAYFEGSTSVREKRYEGFNFDARRGLGSCLHGTGLCRGRDEGNRQSQLR
jgi:hypothetical protein